MLLYAVIIVRGRKCSCKVGFTGNGFACQDINECTKERTSSCVNTEGSFYCVCPSGFSLTNKTTCLDINECDKLENPCSVNEECKNTDGSFECNCKTGYYRPARDMNCLDVDECQQKTCHVNATCLNTIGSHTCTCNRGFEDGIMCEDVDECINNKLCPSFSVCVNSPGAFVCSCLNGTLVLNNTCITPSQQCNPGCHLRGLCHPSPSGYQCVCDKGYVEHLNMSKPLNLC
uniref:EGF-like domain-containing protein n=1 Tax=Periophthalmus magnuspinnatus TaxID=409849 RepID=A0A3B4B0K8_9GOBI